MTTTRTRKTAAARAGKKAAPSRPSLTPKVTRGTEHDRRAALDEGLRITIPTPDGDDVEVFEVRVGDVSSSMVRELRARTGHSLNRLMFLVKRDPDLDVISAWAWLARRVDGEDVSLDDVEITYRQLLGDDFEVEGLDHDTPSATSPEV